MLGGGAFAFFEVNVALSMKLRHEKVRDFWPVLHTLKYRS